MERQMAPTGYISWKLLEPTMTSHTLQLSIVHYLRPSGGGISNRAWEGDFYGKDKVFIVSLPNMGLGF